MEKRPKQLKELQLYVQGVDKELTMILQRLQWDRLHLLEKNALVTCKYNTHHKIPPDKREIHENECYLKCQGYTKTDILLPDPVDSDSNTVVKLDKQMISEIINKASTSDPLNKKGVGHQGTEPMTLDRLQSTYTADERRAIHDAVVSAVPSCHDLTDLALPSGSNDEQQSSKSKSRMEILAELRDMKRRRAKYRVAAKTKNYSDVLRDVIKTQMELYNEAQNGSTCTEIKIEKGGTCKYVDNNCKHNDSQYKYGSYNKDDRVDRHPYRKEPHPDRVDSKYSFKKHPRSQDEHEDIYMSREKLRASSSTDPKTKYYDVDRKKRDKERDTYYMNISKERSEYYHKSHRAVNETHEGNSSKDRRSEESYRSRSKYKEKHTDKSERTDKDERHRRYYEMYPGNDKKRIKYNKN